jgi:uncharacterized membrane protein YfcA
MPESEPATEGRRPFTESEMIAGVSWDALFGFFAGLVLATVTTPVGVSGAVFLLPIQLTLLGVPSPAVTPTNLLFNVVSVPGALVRYGRDAVKGVGLTRRLVTATVPAVVVGAVLRVYLLPGGRTFRLIIALFLLPLGLWLLSTSRHGAERPARIRPVLVTVMAAAAGVVGGIYGIGGGSLLAPALVAGGYPVAEVAPAALASTFVTSCAGALAFVVLDATGKSSAGPDWIIGLACGVGGVIGGYLGAALQPRLPRRALRRLLGFAAAGLAIAYFIVAARA